MISIHGTFANVEVVVIQWLKSALPAEFLVVNEEPSDFASAAKPLAAGHPLVVVERVPGGGGDEIWMDTDVDVTIYAATISDLSAAIGPVDVAMRLLPGRGKFAPDDVVQTSGFGRISYANPKVRRAVGGFRITTRPR